MKNKKTLAKLIFVIVLLLLIWYTFRDSMGDIISEIRLTAPSVLLIICISSVIYHFIEGWITCSMARRYNPDFKYRQGIYCAFYCSFYRLSTLGSGAGVAAVYYLGRQKIEYFEAISLYMVQYILHKLGIAVFSGIFFLVNWSFMVDHFHKYIILLLGAYALTVLICIGLVLFCVSKWFHGVLTNLLTRFNKKGRLDKLMDKLQENVKIMEQSATDLIHDRKLLISTLLKNLLKFVFWYSIPFQILAASGMMTFVDSLSTTSLSVMTAAVIPTPAGVGALEFVMTSLFGLVVGVQRAGAITILYRIATFIFPFVVGIFFVIGGRIYRRKQGRPDADILIGNMKNEEKS